jgi:hypothetical protein
MWLKVLYMLGKIPVFACFPGYLIGVYLFFFLLDLQCEFV